MRIREGKSYSDTTLHADVFFDVSNEQGVLM